MAVNATEIERLMIRLQGDASGYMRMLAGAEAATKATMTRIATLGRRLTLGVTLPLAAIGGISTAAFGSFDQAMIQSTSIMQVTEEQTRRMRETALTLSTQAAHAPRDLAEAYFFLASAGLDAEQSIKALPQVMQFATAGAFDLALATDLLTDAQSALGLTVEDNANRNAQNMQRVSDVLVSANTLANASVQQFSEALTNEAGASMRAFNIPLEEGVAVLAAYARQGIKGQVAGSSFSRVLRLMAQAARENGEQMFQVGNQTKRLRDIVFDASGSFRNLADVVGDLEQILEPMSVEMRGATLDAMGFEARIQQAILPLIGLSDVIRDYNVQMDAMGGKTGEVADKQLKSFANQMTILKNRVTVLAIEIGESLAPIVQRIGTTFVDLLEDARNLWRNIFPPEVSMILLTLAGTLGPILLALTGIVKVLGFLRVALVSSLGPVGLFVGAVAGIMALSRAFSRAREEVARLSRELDRLQQIQDSGGQRVLRDIRAIQDPAVRANRIAEEIAGFEDVVRQNQTTIDALENTLADAPGGFIRTVGGILPGLFGEDEAEAQLQRSETLLADARRRLEQNQRMLELLRDMAADVGEQAEPIRDTADQQHRLANEVRELEQALRVQADTFGMSANRAELYRFELEGVSQAELATAEALAARIEALERTEELMARGRQITEQFLLPAERFNQTEAELRELLTEGAISADTFNRALEDARETLEDTNDSMFDLVNTTDRFLGRLDAIAARGPEAMSRIAAQVADFRSVGGTFGGGGFELTAGQLQPTSAAFGGPIRNNDVQRRIVDLLARIADNTDEDQQGNIEIGEANLV